MKVLSAEIDALPNALWIPLGPDVGAVFENLISMGIVEDRHCLLGLPPASGSNAERIQYFLGNKPREILSSRTNAQFIDDRRRRLMEKLAALDSREVPAGGRNDRVANDDVRPEVSLQGSRKIKLDKQLIIFAKVVGGKNKWSILRPHRHPRAENRYVVSKTRSERDYVYLETLAEIPEYFGRRY